MTEKRNQSANLNSTFYRSLHKISCHTGFRPIYLRLDYSMGYYMNGDRNLSHEKNYFDVFYQIAKIFRSKIVYLHENTFFRMVFTKINDILSSCHYS